MAVKFIHHPPAIKMIDRPFFQRVGMALKSARTIISGIDTSTQYSPLQPLAPFNPNITGRTWDFPVGYNVNFIPRGYQTGLTPFAELRNLARNCEILRLGIETCIDQICTFDWQFVPREDSKMSPDDPRIAEITEFFRSPDKIHTFQQWIGAIVEELLVTDSVSIYRTKTRKGTPYAFELLDGATIFPLIDDDGLRPLPPDPAYQQIIKGTPRADYDITELLYMPKKVSVYTPYGFPAVEQIIMTARKAINRDQYQLLYFTAGSVPDAFAEMPEGMTPDDIRAFEERFNNMLTGNAAQRRQVPFLPSGAKINQLKEPILTDAFDEWMARLVMFSLSLPPNAFVKQQNRATAESEKDRALQEGQAPRLQFIKSILDSLILDFGSEYADIEATPRDNANQDPTVTANNIKTLVSTGIKTINEGRADLGLDPIQGGDELMALTATGYVPLDSFEQNQQMQQDNMQAQAEAKATAAQQQQPPAEKAAYSRLRKAVRHKAIPFARPVTKRAEANLRAKITPILRKAGKSVAAQASKHFGKVRKDDSDSDFASTVDLSALDLLVDATPDDLATVASDSGKQALMQLGIEHESGLVNQVHADSLAYARDRAAEMVGKKWVDGELVDNPDAEWVITDSTRDGIRTLISQVESGDLKLTDLSGAIQDSYSFSPERAETIARTEIITANGNGSLAGYKRASESGVKVKKIWEPDAEACPICLENADAGAIDLDDVFPSGDDAPAAHVNCECSLVPEVEDDSEDDGE